MKLESFHYKITVLYLQNFQKTPLQIYIYIYIYVPDQVGTMAQNGTSPNMGWPNKELTTLSPLRPKIP